MYNLTSVKTGVCAPEGFFADGVSAGFKADGSNDVGFIYSEDLCDIAATFTTNKMQAAPIKHFLAKKEFQTNFVLVNSKNANAMTGKKGIADIEYIMQALSTRFENISNPVMSSTGVIGAPLNLKAILDVALCFDLGKKDSNAAAQAIMTTDTYKKEIAFKVTLEDGSSFSIGGIAKGAGMINPAMATMLCFITTDANIPKNEMQTLLEKNISTTFNAISVDGDTSTNDTVMLLANKKSGVYHKEAFEEALHTIMQYLALEMVKDGEGAKKMVAFHVSGAKNNTEAERAAKALSDSLLVKTALFGEDPNWGRIASTIGASGVQSCEENLSISFDDICVYKKGVILFDTENEALAAKIMQKEQFCIYCDLGEGEGSFKAYACDLGYEYVKINADYRT